MPVSYRPATVDDLKPAAEVVKEALNDLEHRFGFDGISGSLETAFPHFCLNEDPAGLWIAEDEGEIVGFAFSWTAEQLWFLAQLFVSPRRQSSGIGRELLTRTLQQAQSAGSTTKALITFAYNRTSLGLYMRHGLFPQIPLYAIAGRANSIAAKRSVSGLDMRRLKPEDSMMLRDIDRKVLGLSRARHHQFSYEDFQVAGFALRDERGTPVGYAYVSNAGQIGPIAVTHTALMGPAVIAACKITADQGGDNVSLLLPGMCGEALKMCLEAGFRLGRTMVLQSSRSFGDWTCYAPKGPGFM
jgi:GNAT superfamily N-acetyltransferase